MMPTTEVGGGVAIARNILATVPIIVCIHNNIASINRLTMFSKHIPATEWPMRGIPMRHVIVAAAAITWTATPGFGVRGSSLAAELVASLMQPVLGAEMFRVVRESNFLMKGLSIFVATNSLAHSSASQIILPGRVAQFRKCGGFI